MAFHTIANEGGPVTAFCAGLGHHVIVAGDDFVIRIINIRTGHNDKQLRGHTGQINAICMLPTGELLSGAEDFTLKRWNLETGAAVDLVPGYFDEKAVQCITALGPSRVAVGCYYDNHVHVINTTGTGEVVDTFERDSDSIGIPSLCTLPGNQLAVGCDSGIVQVWDPSRKRRVAQLRGHEEETAVEALCALPGGRFVSGGEDEIVRIWSFVTRGVEHELVGHTDTVTGLCAVGQHSVASCSNDGSVRVWDTTDGTCVKVLHEHTGPVIGVCTVDGKLASASADGTIIIWDLQKRIRTAGIVQLSRKLNAVPLNVMASIGAFAGVNAANIYGANTNGPRRNRSNSANSSNKNRKTQKNKTNSS